MRVGVGGFLRFGFNSGFGQSLLRKRTAWSNITGLTAKRRHVQVGKPFLIGCVDESGR